MQNLATANSSVGDGYGSSNSQGQPSTIIDHLCLQNDIMLLLLSIKDILTCSHTINQ